MRRSPNAIVSRSIAAIFGGYIVANAIGFALAAVLPLPQVDAVLVAMQAGYLFYVVAALWAFTARSAQTVWLGLSGVAVLSLALWGWLRLG